jgi:hypothetical protein
MVTIVASDSRVLTVRIGNQYTGEVRDGKPEGQGTVFFKDGGRYEGEFKAGKKDGQGFLFFKTGSRYEGTTQI